GGGMLLDQRLQSPLDTGPVKIAALGLVIVVYTQMHCKLSIKNVAGYTRAFVRLGSDEVFGFAWLAVPLRLQPIGFVEEHGIVIRKCFACGGENGIVLLLIPTLAKRDGLRYGIPFRSSWGCFIQLPPRIIEPSFEQVPCLLRHITGPAASACFPRIGGEYICKYDSGSAGLWLSSDPVVDEPNPFFPLRLGIVRR